MSVEEKRARIMRLIEAGDFRAPAVGPGYLWLGDVLRVRHKQSGTVYEVGGEVDRGEGFHEDGRFCVVAGFWNVPEIGLRAWCCWYRFELPSWDWMYLWPAEDCELWPPVSPKPDTR